MTDSTEDHLQQTLFERSAGKCETNDDRITFCKTYLKKVGIDVDSIQQAKREADRQIMARQSYEIKPPSNFERVETFTLTCREQIDARYLTADPRYKEHVKVEMLKKLALEMLKGNFVRFREIKNHEMDSIQIYAGVKVVTWNEEVV